MSGWNFDYRPQTAYHKETDKYDAVIIFEDFADKNIPNLIIDDKNGNQLYNSRWDYDGDDIGAEARDEIAPNWESLMTGDYGNDFSDEEVATWIRNLINETK